MSRYSFPQPINDLSDAFASLPGIGPKMASRLAVYIATHQDLPLPTKLADALDHVTQKVSTCHQCGNISEINTDCAICSDDERDATQLMVVETPTDLVQLEIADVFRGYYIVLGGIISPLSGKSPEDTNIHLLTERLQRDDRVSEVIIALGSTVESEATSLYIHDRLAKKFPQIEVSRLARGLPTGVGVEYLDAETLRGALEGRKVIT